MAKTGFTCISAASPTLSTSPDFKSKRRSPSAPAAHSHGGRAESAVTGAVSARSVMEKPTPAPGPGA
jgi:hypothetical protein